MCEGPRRALRSRRDHGGAPIVEGTPTLTDMVVASGRPIVCVWVLLGVLVGIVRVAPARTVRLALTASRSYAAPCCGYRAPGTAR